MVKYYEFAIDEGQSVVIETDEFSDPGPGPAAAGRVIERAKQTLEQIACELPGIIAPLHKRLVQSIPATEEVRMEFGVKMSGELGAIIAKSQADANFRITLVWKGGAR